MPKEYKIRWRENDIDRLKKSIKNFNQKISYHAKKHPEIAEYLPEKIRFKDVKKSITTRKELNRKLKSLSRFTKRNSEKIVKSDRGAKATKWEVDEFYRKEKLVNKLKAKERKVIENTKVKSRGKELEVTKAQMGTIKENSLQDSHKNFNNMSKKDWEYAKNYINNQLDSNYRENKKEQLRSNYIKGLENIGAPDSLIELVRSIDIDKFLLTIETDTEASFDFFYDILEQQAKIEFLYEVWSNAVSE